MNFLLWNKFFEYIRREATIVNWSKSTTYVKGGWADFVQETDYYSKKWSPISAINDGSQENLIPVKDNPYVCCFENLMYGASGWTQGANNMQLNNIHDLVLIRFADVLLMQSELKEDVAGINRVRARAGLAPLPLTRSKPCRTNVVGNWLSKVFVGMISVVGILQPRHFPNKTISRFIIAVSPIGIRLTMEDMRFVIRLRPVSKRCPKAKLPSEALCRMRVGRVPIASTPDGNRTRPNV